MDECANIFWNNVTFIDSIVATYWSNISALAILYTIAFLSGLTPGAPHLHSEADSPNLTQAPVAWYSSNCKTCFLRIVLYTEDIKQIYSAWVSIWSYCLTTQTFSGHLYSLITECVTDIYKHLINVALLPTICAHTAGLMFHCSSVTVDNKS